MQFPILLVAVIVAITLSTPLVQSARILGIFPHFGKSHHFVFEPLMKALAARGHDVHVISHFPQDKPSKNYTDITIKGSITNFGPTEAISFDMLPAGPSRIAKLMSGFMLAEMGRSTCEAVLAYPTITQLLHSDDKFDLVITELFNADCFLGFVHKFQAPNIAMSSCVLMPWANERFGNPNNPSYIPISMSPFSDRMSFAERLENTVFSLVLKVVYYFTFVRPQQSIATNYFGAEMPSLDEIAMNTSLILVNSHSSLNRPRPLVPAVIEIGGIHVHQPKKLPDDLAKWISEAPEGVIFFSMGSMLRAESLPAEKLSAFLQAFSELPQRVLWKFEGDSWPGQPENLRIGKWLPQRDILGHSNVRMFITHGGLLGTIEAVTSGVPMVGIPMFGDQHANLQAVAAQGTAIIMDYSDITKESLLTAISEVLGNSSYQANAKRLAKEYTDRPSTAMESAIFWTEYVIRHKGAHHLRSAAVDLPWYQYLLLDVALVLLGTLIVLIMIISCSVKIAVGLCRRTNTLKHKLQ